MPTKGKNDSSASVRQSVLVGGPKTQFPLDDVVKWYVFHNYMAPTISTWWNVKMAWRRIEFCCCIDFFLQ
jgi:hypothetical protein